MFPLAPLAFANPWLLAALLGLPALWFLVRVTPPAPRSQTFPAIRLLLGLEPPEETPARTPWWLLLLRLLAVALLIVGLSGPVLHPAGQLGGSGPLVLTLDNGWAAGKDWDSRVQTAEALIDRAERERRRVKVLTTAPRRADAPLDASDLLRPDVARERIRALQPKPWQVDYVAAADAVKQMRLTGSAHVVWLSDGLVAPGSSELATQLQRLGQLELLRPAAGDTALTVLPPERSGQVLEVPLRRAGNAGAVRRTVVATDSRGRLVASAQAQFEADAETAAARFELPLQLRNRIAQVSVEGERHAGAVALLDSRWARRPVGLVSATPLADAQPLLSELYYLDRALKPYAEVSRGTLDELLARDLAVITLPDRGALPVEQRQRVADWVARGGVILRFAGPRLGDDLTGPETGQGPGEPILPVELRRGGRALGGAMSWDSPAKLAPFPQDSPFAGLETPEDVKIERQVLAQPSLELGDKTWARLADGTPLVTAARRGDGWVVLMHTTANTDWSNLPLSGLFVQMLRRVVSVGKGVAAAGGGAPLPPQRVLDGFGRLVAPGAGVKAITPQALADHTVSPAHPPGLYGRKDGGRRAHNLGPAVDEPAPLGNLPPGIAVGGYDARSETRIGPWLLAAGLVLLLADLVVALLLRGLLNRPLLRGRAGAAALLLALALPDPAGAQQDSQGETYALRATTETHLAYIKTGVPQVDRVTEQGLKGLSRVLTSRTSVEPGPPMAVDLSRHPLALFPLLYWSVTPEQTSLTAPQRRKVNDYLRNGGTILFDLREPAIGGSLFGQSSQGSRTLQRLTRGIEIPPLQPVPGDHVLTKAFYLLSDFPGRYEGGQLWVEETGGADGDRVANVLVASNDYVGAWAIDQAGRPRFAVTPGGERQREMAYRVGINVVMYALTGNYKSDQVHVPAILERLGQ